MLSERLFFVIERISDILKLEEEKQVEILKRIKELQKELSRIYDYLRDVESKHDDNRLLLYYEQKFVFHLSSIADSSDNILDRVISEDVDVHDIDTLLENIRNSCNPFCTTPIKYKFLKDRGVDHSKSSKGKQDSTPKSFDYYPNPHPVGFKHEIETLLNHLLQSHDETCYVGIVGMGGLGKTALAKHIYHHRQINTRFNCKVWICISQSWDKTSILNQIWRQATGDHMSTEMGYDLIVYRLYTFLSSQSFLIILDDIWSIDAWSDIYQAFPNNHRSTLVITTRNKNLPKIIDPNVFIVEPKQLSEEESFELLRRKTYLPNESIPSVLKQHGMEMVKNCKGLPLAINALAGILKMNKSQSYWKKISKELAYIILNMGDEPTQGVVKELLALSYHKLPPHLKPCVLYLHVFPENSEIEAQKLIRMWIAEWFVDEVFEAEKYLNEMAQRCIVEVVKTNYKGLVRRFRINDLMQQMLVDMNKERGLLNYPLRLVPKTTLYGDEQKKKSYDSRMEVLLEYLYASSHVRSLVFLNFQDLENLKLEPMFKKLRLLRVLILDYIPMKELPEEIGKLIHLRYLELSGSPDHLPGSIGNLENLSTIDIRKLYTSAVKINMGKLKELRHLYMPIEVEMEVLKLEELKKLKTLWGVKGGEWMLLGMPNLSATLQELCVRDIRSEEQLMAVFTTPSITSNNLHTLVLMWYTIPVKLCGMSILNKCESLKKLEVRGAYRSKYVNSFSTQSYQTGDGKHVYVRKRSDEHNK